jgi:hypothetical protein
MNREREARNMGSGDEFCQGLYEAAQRMRRRARIAFFRKCVYSRSYERKVIAAFSLCLAHGQVV